jgi:hypothetical protein
VNRLSQHALRRGESANLSPRPGEAELSGVAAPAAAREPPPTIKGALRSFCTVELPIGLKIHDVLVLVAARGAAWAGLPAKPQLDKEGRQKVDATGNGLYRPVRERRDRVPRDRFSAALVELILAEHPDALDGGGGR